MLKNIQYWHLWLFVMRNHNKKEWCRHTHCSAWQRHWRTMDSDKLDLYICPHLGTCLLTYIIYRALHNVPTCTSYISTPFLNVVPEVIHLYINSHIPCLSAYITQLCTIYTTTSSTSLCIHDIPYSRYELLPLRPKVPQI